MTTTSNNLRTPIMVAIDKGDEIHQQTASHFSVSLGFVKKLIGQSNRLDIIENLHHRAAKQDPPESQAPEAGSA